MKTCPFCGKEYPDHVVRCLIDSELLSGGDPPPPSIDAAAARGVPPLLSAPAPAAPCWTEQQLRIFELVLVCLIAFGGSILSSGHSLMYGHSATSASGAYGWFYNMFREVMALGLLGYVLMRRGKTFSDLGLRWAVTDFGWSIILRLGGYVAFMAIYGAIYYTRLTDVSDHASSLQVGKYLFGGGISLATILFQFLNPFFEELIVRAYVMTEIQFLTNSLPKAILASTLLQTSYHFYQGVPTAIAHGGTFLLFSIFYAKTGRITPVILAHLYADVGGTLGYGLGHS